MKNLASYLAHEEMLMSKPMPTPTLTPNFDCNSQPFIIERLAKKGLKFFILEICVTFKTIVY